LEIQRGSAADRGWGLTYGCYPPITDKVYKFGLSVILSETDRKNFILGAALPDSAILSKTVNIWLLELNILG